MPVFTASLLSYGLTDETYAVAMNHYQDHPATSAYMAGLNLTSHLGWIGGSLLGAVLGSFITNTDQFGLGFALPAMYTCLLIFMIKRKADIWVAVSAAVICLVIGYLVPAAMSNLSNIIFATIIAATLGVMINGQH
jgi:predicted branched-subunit amino acid permease